MQNQYQTIKRLKIALITVSISSFMFILFIGSNNIKTTEAARNFEKDLEIEKAKAQYYKNEFDDLVQSGTCLERLPELETL